MNHHHISPSLSLAQQKCQKEHKKEVRAVLGELNAQWKTQYDHKITSILPRMQFS